MMSGHDDIVNLLREISSGADAARERLWLLLVGEIQMAVDRILARQLPNRRPSREVSLHLAHQSYNELPAAWFESASASDVIDLAAVTVRRLIDSQYTHTKITQHALMERSLDLSPDEAERRWTITKYKVLPDALAALQRTDDLRARIASLRLVQGLDFDAISEHLAAPASRVRLEWSLAKTWLEERLPGGLPQLPRREHSGLITLELIRPDVITAVCRHPDLLKTMSGRDFEYLLAGVLERFGYQIELQRGTKDGGVDIFAVRSSGTFGVHRYLVQAKRWTNPVGVEPVRELLFLHSYHKVTKSCLATTSRFTRGAWKLYADYRWNLELKDFEALRDLILQASRMAGR